VDVEGVGVFDALLDPSKNARTVKALLNAMPLSGIAERWGDELYFDCGVEVGEKSSQREVNVGDMAYWPQGRAVCIFFGTTPISKDDRPIAYSDVNVVGRILGDISLLKSARGGCSIKIYRLQL